MGPKNDVTLQNVTIQDALETMGGNTQKNRTDGVNNLKKIFQYNHKSQNLKVSLLLSTSVHFLTVNSDALKDGAYHRIFEALFKVARVEKQAYLIAKNAAQKTKAEQVLSACSDVLRVTIRAGAEKLKPKTVKAVIEHVTQLLPVADGEHCTGLSKFYFKVLCSVLEHEAHIEHLEEADWLSTVDYCLQGIEQYGGDAAGEAISSSRNFPSVINTTSFSGHTSSAKLSVRSLSDGNSTNSITKRNSEELLQCLLYLISASNAPILERAEKILEGIMHFLESHGTFVSPIHRVAFSAVNHLLSATNTDKTSLSQSCAFRLVPIIGNLWSSKILPKDGMLNSIKDEMLITILLLRLHLEHIISNHENSFEPKLEDLEMALRMEYTRHRDQLQLDDLDMSTFSGDVTAMGSLPIGMLRLRTHAAQGAERSWAILAALSVLDGLLHIHEEPLPPDADGNDGEIDSSRHPRKRRRLARRFDGLLERITSHNFEESVVALQTLLALLPGSKLSQQDLNEVLEHLAPCIFDRRHEIGSWAMLCIASCTSQNAANLDSCSFEWAQLWHTAAKLITNPVTCRAACYLLHSIMANGLVLYQNIAEDVDAMVTATEISAPAILSDSSLSLMTHILHVRNMEVLGGSTVVCHHIIRWISARWNPAEKSFAARCAVDVHPIDILNLLRKGLGLPIFRLSFMKKVPSGIIGQSWAQLVHQEGMIRYLLLLQDSPIKGMTCPDCVGGERFHKSERLSDCSAHGNSTRRLILELFLPKFRSLVEDWDSHGTEESTRVSTDTLRSTASACVLGCLLLSLITDTGFMQLQEQLHSAIKSLTKYGLAQFRIGVETQNLVESMLQAIQPYIPETNSSELAHLIEHNPKLHQLFDEVVECLRLRQSVIEDVTIVRVDDPMDVDDMFDTQRSRPRESEPGMALVRRDLPMSLSPAAFFSTAMAQLVLVSETGKINKATIGIPSGFVQYLVGLNPRETLLCRHIIRDVLQSDLQLQPTDLPRLLEHVGEILSFPEFVCCEVALGLCADVLSSLVSIWTNPEEGDSAENAIELYEWLIGVVLPKRRPSQIVQMSLANLLSELMRVHPSYGEIRQLPSVRTCLFEILQKGPIPVKFHVAEKLPNMFGLFVLKHHNGILIDLLPSLPSDPDWTEGIAFRLKVLGTLASRWSTLIRLCTYYILEVPGRLSDSIKHATRCLADVSHVLGLSNTRELFHLFASQLLYTWLDSEPVEGFPFEIFGYKSLQEFVQDNQEEITALMTMRDQDDGVLKVASLLEVSVEELLQHCFSKVMAYSVAHDISIPHSASGKKYVTGEARIRKRLGKDVFFDLVNRRFADVIALFFTLIDQEEQIVEKSFDKDPGLHYAAVAMNEMKSTSSSEIALPPNQQPAFKARYLTSEIEHICGRTEYEAAYLYSPAMIVFIARHVMATVHSALGSLHACAVLRKLRVLIALSEVNSIQGYPIEMLLQAVRPFLTDSECASDAIGITQYLLSKGSPYLSTSPSFVAGISLTILASLRAFLESSPTSTTQQSQYRLTLSKAQSFHSWLGSYLATYNPSGLERSSEVAFRTIIQSAHTFRDEGNADRGTAESELLLELLDDERSGRHLLSRPSRTLGFSLLYRSFRQPLSFRSDVLGSDEHAVAFAPTIWNFCQNALMSGSFLVWAAKIIGRAFASTGHIHQQLLQESGLRHIMDLGNAPLNEMSSKACLLKLLQNLTLSDNFQAAGLAEAVLRVIITRPHTPVDEKETSLYRKSLSGPLYNASDWTPYHAPASDMLILQASSPVDPFGADSIIQPHWPRMLAASLVQSTPSETILYALQRLLREAEGFAEEAFPFIVHLVLSLQFDESPTAKRQLSKSLRLWLGSEQSLDATHIKLLMNTLLYLRAQPYPGETSSAERLHWLEVDYAKAAEAAARCGMFKTALLFVEISVSESSRTSRRSSAGKSAEPQEILLLIFKHIDDPDIFYGLQQSASLATVMQRLEYENDGMKSLAFRGAQYDVHLRRQDKSSTYDAQALVNALGMLSLDGLSHSLLQSQQTVSMDAHSMKRMFQTARKLEQWDLPMPSSSENEAFTMYKTFQAVNLSEDRGSIVKAVEDGLRSTLSGLIQRKSKADSIHTSLQTLAALTEMDEILSASNSEQFEEMLARFQSRSSWMRTGKFDDVNHIMSCRETVLSCLSQQPHLRRIINVSSSDSRLVEVQTTLLSSSLSRAHSQLQESLTSATYLTSLIEPCQALGLSVEAAAQLEAANALWEQGEMTSSIGMLQALEKNSILKKQTISIGRSDLLAKIGYQVSVARLEKPDRIIEKYLLPALKELKGKAEGNEAGQVFHEFAVFCDQQLQDADGLEDLIRLRKLKEMKASEVQELGKMVKSATSSEQKAKYHGHLVKAKQWLQLDTEEYRRLSASKDELLRQSLENYLLSLTASDGHNNDALRFTALWLEHSEEDIAMDSVSKYLTKVPSRKFASLMNQLTSRLLNSANRFQQILFSLILRICIEHPYHGMYQIWAGCKSKSNSKDETAVSRQAATNKVAQEIASNSKSTKTWTAISKTSTVYCQLAAERDETRYKAGQKIQLKDSPSGTLMNSILSKFLTAPPTLQVNIAADLDYSKVPVMQRLEPQISIASGVSAPKIITVIASDGSRYKQLVKGGNDDLRQDAIMEQVFAQVSELLKTNSSTRQRNLGIRTYKVLPLSSNAGIIEFVSNTIPLHEFLMPAHERYYPKDLKGSHCRKQIGDVQTQKMEIRVKTYRTVADQFHPVMRYFFMEKFYDPDEWFAKRLAYTRSTAAISMLGHVLGLGDRHGHNILLDEKTGEVVHIDLGVAFEMGRVLPVPELVPFRLTRDIVDGMGITKTEGVYRRCCEFTLEALRKESYSIVTILDVLRYDPLYSWSISPVRLAKLQDAQSAAPALNAASEATGGRNKTREVVNEPSEADRALTVVKKKLSKTLSVTATVNDLINQASDERNLAVLYSGWAAYA